MVVCVFLGICPPFQLWLSNLLAFGVSIICLTSYFFTLGSSGVFTWLLKFARDVLHVVASVLRKFRLTKNKGSPSCQPFRKQVKTDKHNSLRTRSALAPLEPGAHTWNSGCYLEKMVLFWGWGWDNSKLKSQKVLLPCFSGLFLG